MKLQSLQIKKKKAVSEMVGYVLLVVVAIGISILVYSYLKFYIPKDNLSCQDGTSLVIVKYSCISGNPGSLVLTLSNKGLFNISAAYVRIGEENRKVKQLVTNESVYFVNPLGPGQETTLSYLLKGYVPSPGRYGLEIEPGTISEDNKQLALCSEAIITQSITCD